VSKQKNILFISLLGIGSLSLVRCFDAADSWIIDIVSQFPFQYGLASLVLFVLSFRKKLYVFSVIAGILCVFNMSAVVDIEKPSHAAGNVRDAFSVYSANIHKNNMDLSTLRKEIQRISPDIVLLLEVTPKQKDQLLPIMVAYEHHIENIVDDRLGFVFLSRFPMYGYHVTKLSKYGNSLLEVRLSYRQKPVIFYGMHAQRPDRADFTERKMQFFGPARQIKGQSLPAIVAGDFNATPYSPVFREFVQIAGLKDSREGFGWQPSWPTFFPPLWIPIDHILVTPDFQVVKRTTGSYIGSDHYPVIAELSMQ